jgi:hypothetical protein
MPHAKLKPQFHGRRTAGVAAFTRRSRQKSETGAVVLDEQALGHRALLHPSRIAGYGVTTTTMAMAVGSLSVPGRENRDNDRTFRGERAACDFDSENIRARF